MARHHKIDTAGCLFVITDERQISYYYSTVDSLDPIGAVELSNPGQRPARYTFQQFGYKDAEAFCNAITTLISECLEESLDKVQFIDPTPIIVFHEDDVKCLEPIELVKYFDCINNSFAVFEQGVSPEEGNIFNLDNYYTMSDKLRERGRLVEESAVVVTPYPAHELTICVDAATDADVIADIEATPAHAALIAALPVPPTGAAYGISSLKLRKIEGQKGMTVRCDKTEADAPLGTDANTIGSFVTPFDSGTEILPDGESDLINRPATAFTYTDPTDPTVCKPAYEDGSQLVAGDVTFTNGTAAGAYAVDYCIACYAVKP